MPVSMPISCSIETRSSVAMLPVAPGGTGQPPSSPKLDSNELDAGLERGEHVGQALAAGVVEVRGELDLVAERVARRPGRSRAPARGLAMPVVSPKPISCGAGAAQPAGDLEHALGRDVALVGAAERDRDHALAAQPLAAGAAEHAPRARSATPRSSG